MYQYLAHTVKGFEGISDDEITFAVPGSRILEKRTKFIQFEAPETPNHIPLLQSIDDLGFIVSHTSELSLTKEDITQLRSLHSAISGYRDLDDTFSITLSKYKAKIPDEDDTLAELIQKLSKGLNMKYTPRKHDNFDIRFDISSEETLISVRAFLKPVFHRDYRINSQPGALRPSIAGGMVLATIGNRKNLAVVDNLCGSGTILCESALAGHKPSGGDISEQAVKTARANIRTIQSKFAENIRTLDGTHTPWRDEEFDVAISNLPWDRQISVKSVMQLYKNVIVEYGRILRPNCVIGLLSRKPDLVKKYLREVFGEIMMDEYPLGFLGQNPTFIVGRKGI